MTNGTEVGTVLKIEDLRLEADNEGVDSKRKFVFSGYG